MKIIYSIIIFLYLFSIRIASFINSKAKLWVDGRKKIFQNLNSEFLSSNISPNDKLIWFHCASLGEFEQGRPLMEKIKLNYPNFKIILTFFSPSGYEIRKNYFGADYVFYLPMDTPKNAKKFIAIVKPQIAIFVKYEFWFNYLSELRKQNIPTYLICGVFRRDQYFFNFYGTWFLKQLKSFTHFFLQDDSSKELISSFGFNNATSDGDTRFDRVCEISKNAKEINIVKTFVSDKKIIVAGSTWDLDEKIISGFKFQNSEFKLIIAPHEVDEKNIYSITKRFEGASIVRFSEASLKNLLSADILIIDNIGMLSSLYKYASIAYVGGGFGKGIHNILEAAAFGLPIIIGPNYHKFIEAKELIQLGGLFSINSEIEFKNIIAFLNNTDTRLTASEISNKYIFERVGATDKIYNSIFN